MLRAGPLLAAARSRGATVNDLLVASVAGALHGLLEARGEHPDPLVVSVPVSSRASAGDLGPGNAVGAVPVRVPLGADPEARVTALVGQHATLRGGAPGSTAAVLTPIFRALAAVGLFQLLVDHQRLVHTFVTNVRGPARPVAVAGSAVRAVVPVATNPGDVAASFDALSYAGQLVVTVVTDPAAVPEAAWLAGELERSLRGWRPLGAGGVAVRRAGRPRTRPTR